jgi:hypothetical protein
VEGSTKRFARYALTISVVAIALGYVSAFTSGIVRLWGPWLLAFGIPLSFVSIMIMGAVRDKGGIRKLAIPFLFVGTLLTLGFILALALPVENAASRLVLGLPLRAALIIYGVGLLPIVVLPVAYALTFETQTLNQDDIEKVRKLGAAYRLSQNAKEVL